MDTIDVDRVRVHLAVGDYHNGDHTGYVRSIQIDDILDLEADRSIACRVFGIPGRSTKKLKFGRLTVQTFGYSTWVGNWCWDCALVGMDDAARIVNYCQKAGWSISAGETSLFDKYESGQAITADDLRMALLEVKA